MSLGSRIQFHRTRRGLSQDALANKLGVSRQSVSKWELDLALPEIDKVVMLSLMWGITTDELLLGELPPFLNPSKDILRWGLYLIVKDFAKSILFYENFLSRRASIIGVNRFAEFRFDGKCWLSVLNEKHLPGHDYTGTGDHKFALCLWAKNLQQEHERLKSLDIGHVTEIMRPFPGYHFFNLTDPDKNIIEITGEYNEGGI